MTVKEPLLVSGPNEAARLDVLRRSKANMAIIQITPELFINESELEERFIQASGPGGQNVNKVATAVQLRFDATASSLPTTVRERLLRLAGRRATADGAIVITAREHRTQERNRAAARERLIELIVEACRTQKPRIATRPTLASKLRRVKAKAQRSFIKQARAKPGVSD
jgi:ribosome-associated protein